MTNDNGPIPDSDAASTTDDVEMTPEQLSEAQEYNRKELLCDLTGRAVDIGFLALMALVFVRTDGWLWNWIPGEQYSETLRLTALFSILIGLNFVVSFPLSLYAGHLLEHQYGMSNLSLPGWLWRYFKSHLLEFLFGLGLTVGLYWLIWLTKSWWWLVAAVAFFLVSVVVGQLAPVLIMPLFFKIEKIQDTDQSEQLGDRMDRLATGTGLSIEGVYRMDLSTETVKANAMLAGLGRTRRVILGDTLLQGFTLDEIEIVIAHEVGHHVFGHIRKLMIGGAIISAGGFWACDQLLQLWMHTSSQVVDYSKFPIDSLPILLLIITLLSTVVEPVQNAISRRFERQCDRYALERTGLRDAYVSAFSRLAKLNKDDPDPHPLEVLLFHSHPPIAQRLAMAEQA